MTNTTLPTPSRPFVPADINPTDLPRVEALYRTLLERPVETKQALIDFLLDLSALGEVLDEAYSRAHNAHACNTEDPALEKAYMLFAQEIFPKLQPLSFELQKKFVASPALKDLTEPKMKVLIRKWQAEIDLYRETNIPLQTRVTELSTQYNKLCGRMVVEFKGKQYTLQQMARFLEETDRPTREAAWRLTAGRRLQDKDQVEETFEQLFAIRTQMAKNADLPDYRAYAWKSFKRFDYTPDQCLQFADAIATQCVPVVRRLDERRKATLGVDTLRPWDLSVDAKGRAPLHPFDEKDIPGFLAKTTQVLEKVSPALAKQFANLKEGRNLDLGSRKGKRPGGYQSSLELSREPFIFMNAAGLHDDVETLLHEAGHAFHFLAACDEPIVDLRSPGLEFCEVASMSMELFSADHLGVFYSPADALRAKRGVLERVIRFLPWMATIDSFQHWLYTHPDHTRAGRREQWLAILDRFYSPVIDFSGFEENRATLWHRQLHLFNYAFYYIEYGIAQLGALQLWLQYKKDPKSAIANYQKALAIGGRAPLPELFAAAQIPFDFSDKALAPLMQALDKELASLPD
jgi:oligoendopeptidase F